MLLGKTLESPLDCKEVKPVNLKGNQSWKFIGRTDAEAETPILWPSCCCGRLKAGEGDDRRWDGWMSSQTWWTLVWVDSGSWWCYLNILFSVVPFSFCLQSFLISGPFPRSQFFASGGQSIRASASVLPMNIQDWSPLGWTAWISSQSKGLKSLLQCHSSKASILWCSAFFIVQLSHPNMEKP